MARRACERYGPGRLPYASRRDVGGGVAMAATGTLGVLLWFGGAWLLLATGTAHGDLGFLFGVGLFFLPFAAPTSFLVGLLLWRYAHSDANRQFRGALLGATTSLVSLSAGAMALAAFVAADNVSRGEMGLVEAAVFSVLLAPVAFLFALVAAGWLILPLGALGGWYHERAKTRGKDAAPDDT